MDASGQEQRPVMRHWFSRTIPVTSFAGALTDDLDQ